MIESRVESLPVGGERHTLVAEYSEQQGFGVTRKIKHLNVFGPQDITEGEAALYAERSVGQSIWMLIDLEYNATEV